MPHHATRERDRWLQWAVLLVVSSGFLLAFTYFGVAAQHAAGVYTQGQIRFIQAHARAVQGLHRYAETADDAQLRAALDALLVPELYERTRKALMTGDAAERAAEGFVGGGITPGDAERAARFFPIFRRVDPVERAIAAWRASDAQFDSLRASAAALRAAHRRADAAAIRSLRTRIDRADAELRRLEGEFALGIAGASRLLPPIVLVVGIVLGTLLVGGALVAMQRIARVADDAAAALREREAQLRHTQKLEAVGRLAGGIAHEFNNILTAITGNLELAIQDLPRASSSRSDLTSALLAARRASGLTRQLLLFSRRDAVDIRAVDVGRLVRELEPVLRRLLSDDQAIEARVLASEVTVLADAGQLQQVLLNLVANARDAMPAGRIEIAVAREPSAAIERRAGLVTGAAAASASGHWVTLVVRDTGAGMSTEVRERLFEPFFTTKPPGAGTGLGLSVVSGIVTQLGGRIFVESEPGRGTTFTIALPALEGAAVDEGPRAEDELRDDAGTRAGQPTVVLLVEDEPAVRTATRRILERAGFVVREAEHGAAALAAWEAQRPDIVVTDFMMPGLSGIELLERFRAEDPGIPALLVSGYTGGDSIDLARLGERIELIRKPFTRAELLDALRRLAPRREAT